MAKRRKHRKRRGAASPQAGQHGGVALSPGAATASARSVAKSAAKSGLLTTQHPFQRWLPQVAGATLFLLALVSYWEVFFAGFIWDDRVFHSAAPIAELSGLGDIWFNLARSVPLETHYWPLVYTTFWLEHKLWGFNPLGYHLVNVLLHGAVSVVLWRLLAKMAVPGAWLIAAVFVLHPVHVESVAWVIGRKDLLATLFYLLTATYWLRYRERPTSRTLLIMLALFTAGMFSKSFVITLPAALLVWVWWQYGRITSRDFSRVMPLFLLALVLGAVDINHHIDKAIIQFSYEPWEHLIIASKALWFYPIKLLLPYPLMVMYPLWDINPANLLNWLPLLAAPVFALGLWLARHRIGRGPLAGALFYAITISPMLGFFPNVYMVFTFAADRYQYLAGTGLLVVLIAAAVTAYQHILASLTPDEPASNTRGSGAAQANVAQTAAEEGDTGIHSNAQEAAADTRRSNALHGLVNYAGKALAVLLLLTCGVLSWQQTQIYRDDVTFWQDVIAHSPTAANAYFELGTALGEQGRLEEAVEAFRLDIPRSYNPVVSHTNISFMLYQLERYQESEVAARAALELDPDSQQAKDNLIATLYSQQRYEETLPLLQQIAEQSTSAEHYYRMGHIALNDLNRPQEAQRYFLQVLAIDPGHQDARAGLDYIRSGANRSQ
ncbi:MAG: glycosyltransferase family 39 protein [Pseudohongiellaceae bacterium]